MRRIVRRPRADDDLLGIWNYVAADDADAADRLLDRINARLQSLAASPLIGSERAELYEGLRSAVTGNYVIFYLPITNGIDVVRVLHGARDITRIFREG